MAILIEHFAGKWPFWLSPKQAVIVTVSDNFVEYAEKVHKRLHYEGFQVSLDKGGHTLQKKIVLAEQMDYNYILVVGKDEMNANSVDVRTRERERIGQFSITKLIEFFRSLAPPKSARENKIIEEMYKENSNNESEINKLEERLNNKLFLSGMEITDEDKVVYEKYKSVELTAEANPNLFKWRKIMELSMK